MLLLVDLLFFNGIIYLMNIEKKKYGGHPLSSKENVETGKQSGQSDRKRSTNEKQPEILSKENGVENNAHIERAEKNIELNNAVHTVESRFKRFNRMLRAGVLAAAMMISPSDEKLNQQKSYEIHETHRHQDEQRAINTLNKIFNNGEEILKACGGVIQGETYQGNDNAPTFIHIAQNHGEQRDFTFNPGMYLSQYYATECMVSMIKGNATGKILPIGIELLMSEESPEERLKSLIDFSLRRTILFKGYGTFHFYDENNNEDKKFNDYFFNQFPYPVRPEQLQGLEQPPISIMKRLAPEKMKAVLPEDGTNIKTEAKFNETVSNLMEILHEIEEEYNVRFSVADVPFFEGVLSDDLEETYEDVFTKRENHVADSLRSLAKKYDTKVAISLFGSAHDFRDDVVGKGMNFMRVETAPVNVHDEIFNYKMLYRSKFDSPESKCHMPLTAGEMDKWITEKGGAARMKSYVKNTRQFDFLFHYIHEIQHVLKSDSEEFTSEELFSIMSENIKNQPGTWSHQVYGDLDKFKDYLSAEQFATIKKMVTECKRNTGTFETKCFDRIYVREEMEYYRRLLASGKIDKKHFVERMQDIIHNRLGFPRENSTTHPQ